MRKLAQVIRKSEADLMERIGSASIPTSISVDVKDLARMWAALDSAAQYLQRRDWANATLHLESVRRSPLTVRLVYARERLEKVLVDAIPLPEGRPAATPTQPEKVPIKVLEKSYDKKESEHP